MDRPNCTQFPWLKCAHISLWLNPTGHSKFHNTLTPSACYRPRLECFCPPSRREKRRKPARVPVTGVRYNSLLWPDLAQISSCQMYTLVVQSKLRRGIHNITKCILFHIIQLLYIIYNYIIIDHISFTFICTFIQYKLCMYVLMYDYIYILFVCLFVCMYVYVYMYTCAVGTGITTSVVTIIIVITTKSTKSTITISKN